MYPLKQGLKQQLRMATPEEVAVFTHVSIKTRIETCQIRQCIL